MTTTRLLVSTDQQFSDYRQALAHISATLLAAGIVTPGYGAALEARETQYPTGISLERHAVAIPHCEAEHALEPAIYLLRLAQPVEFRQADGDDMVAVRLIIALVVTHPTEQLRLLRTLFGRLQDPALVEGLLTTDAPSLGRVFRQSIFNENQKNEESHCET
ncbi:PTS galactitol transporter subunit IIA [Sodalis sp. RH21]|uniref:PTS galactitol transporter subunit IIA n=1 Tax=unclassified Sodalis (in: enterobacteria) TaxID=2636512 RepID=UPI0039B60DC8